MTASASHGAPGSAENGSNSQASVPNPSASLPAAFPTAPNLTVCAVVFALSGFLCALVRNRLVQTPWCHVEVHDPHVRNLARHLPVRSWSWRRVGKRSRQTDSATRRGVRRPCFGRGHLGRVERHAARRAPQSVAVAHVAAFALLRFRKHRRQCGRARLHAALASGIGGESSAGGMVVGFHQGIFRPAGAARLARRRS